MYQSRFTKTLPKNPINRIVKWGNKTTQKSVRGVFLITPWAFFFFRERYLIIRESCTTIFNFN